MMTTLVLCAESSGTKIAAADQPRPQRCKIPWRYVVEIHGARRVLFDRPAVDGDTLRPVAVFVADRRQQREARGGDARHSRYSFERVRVVRRQPFAFVAGDDRVGRDDEHVVAVEAGVLSEHGRQAPDKKRRAHSSTIVIAT